MCYGENGTVKFFETLADNNYSMMQIKKKIEWWENFRVTQVYYLKQWFFTGVFDVSVRQTWCPKENLKEIKIPGWKSVVGYNFERGTWLDHPFKVWLNLAEWLQKIFNWFFVKISLINMHVFVKNRQNAKSFFKSCNTS